MRDNVSMRRRRRSPAQRWLIATLIAAFGVSLVGADSVAWGSRAKKSKHKPAGCVPEKEAGQSERSKGRICVGTTIEAWYHITPASDAPVEAPEEGPEQSQHPSNTLHVGRTLGEEDARTYLTFDLSAIPVGSTIEDLVLFLPLDGDGGTQEPRIASFLACPVAEPPEKSKDGSFEQPPEAECAKSVASEPATFDTKPRPYFQIDLGRIAESLVTGSGIALVPTNTETQQLKTWELAFYTRKNKDKDAEPISALVSYRAVGSLPTSGQPPLSSGGQSGGQSVESFDTGGGVDVPPTSSGVANAPPGTLGDALDEQVAAPVDAGTPITATPAVAIELDPRAYGVVWLVPLILLLSVAFWSAVLNREIKLPPR